MRKLLRRGTAFLCALIIAMCSLAVPVYAETDINTVSFSKLASAASGFISDVVARQEWMTGSGDGTNSYNTYFKGTTGGLTPGNAGGFLGYPDEANCSGVVWDWLSSQSTTGSVTYSYTSLREVGNMAGSATGNNPLVAYALFGRFMSQLGFDETGTASGGLLRSLSGWFLRVIYQLSNFVNLLFQQVIRALEYLNPFAFFNLVTYRDSVDIDDIDGMMSDYQDSAVQPGNIEDAIENPDAATGPMIDAGGIGDVYYYMQQVWVWGLVLPFFAIILAWNLLVSKRKNKGVEIKKFIWRVFSVTLLIALLGGTYTTVLGQLGKMYGTVSPASRVIMSTFFDFQSWVEDAHMSIPSGLYLYADENGAPSDETILSARTLALRLNLHSLVSAVGEDEAAWASKIVTDAGADGSLSTGSWTDSGTATTDWNNSMRANAQGWDITSESTEWVNDLLSRYGENSFYRGSDWEAYYKTNYLDLSGSDVDGTAGQSLANIIQHTDDALDWKKIDTIVDTPGKQLIVDTGTVDDFEVSGESYEYNNSPNPWNTTTAYRALDEFDDDSNYKVVSTSEGMSGSGYFLVAGSSQFTIYGGTNALLSPMSIFNYLNTTFTDTGLVVYNSDLSSSSHTRDFHYAVSLVGDSSLRFLYCLNAIVLMGCLTVLSLFYACAIIFGSIRRTIQVIISVPIVMLGSLRFAAKLIYHVIMMIAEVVLTMLIYGVVCDLLVSMMTILETLFANAAATATEESLTAGTDVAGTVSTQLLSVNSGTIMFSNLFSVPMADDGFFDAKTLELITVVLSIFIYVVLTIIMIRYRKVIVKGVDEMVGDWTTSFVPGARRNDMDMPDSQVAANLGKGMGRTAGAVGAGIGAKMAADNATKAAEQERMANETEGDTEENEEGDVKEGDKNESTQNSSMSVQAGEEQGGGKSDADGTGMSGEEPANGVGGSIKDDMADRRLANAVIASGLGGPKAGVQGSTAETTAHAGAGDADGNADEDGYDDLVGPTAPVSKAGEGSEIYVNDSDSTKVQTTAPDDPDDDDETKENAGNAAAGLTALTANRALTGANVKDKDTPLSDDDLEAIQANTEDAVESRMDGLRKGRDAAQDALGRELSTSEKAAADAATAVTGLDQDDIVDKAARAGAESVANGPLSQEQLDKIAEPIKEKLSKGELEQSAVQGAVEQAMRNELGRDLTDAEKVSAKQIAAQTISDNKAAATDAAKMEHAAVAGARAAVGRELTDAEQKRAIEAGQEAVAQAQYETSVEGAAVKEGTRCAVSAAGGKLTSDQREAVEDLSKSIASDYENVALAAAKEANGGKELTAEQAEVAKKSVAGLAAGEAAVQSANMIRASKGLDKLDAKTESVVRARAASSVNKARDAASGRGAVDAGFKAGAAAMGVTPDTMTAKQADAMNGALEKEQARAEAVDAQATVAGMAGSAAVSGTRFVNSGASEASLSKAAEQGHKYGQRMSARMNNVVIGANAGKAAAFAVQKSGMAKPGMTSEEVRKTGAMAGYATVVGAVGVGSAVYAKQAGTLTQASQQGRVGATSVQNNDGTGTKVQQSGGQGSSGSQKSGGGSAPAEKPQMDYRFVRISASKAASESQNYTQMAADMKVQADKMADQKGAAKHQAVLYQASATLRNNAQMLDYSARQLSGKKSVKTAERLVADAAETRKQAEKLAKRGFADEAGALNRQAIVMEQRANTMSPGVSQRQRNKEYARKVAAFTYLAGSNSALISAIGQAGGVGTHMSFWNDMENRRATARNGGRVLGAGGGQGNGMTGYAMNQAISPRSGGSRSSGGSGQPAGGSTYAERQAAWKQVHRANVDAQAQAYHDGVDATTLENQRKEQARLSQKQAQEQTKRQVRQVQRQVRSTEVVRDTAQKGKTAADKAAKTNEFKASKLQEQVDAARLKEQETGLENQDTEHRTDKIGEPSFGEAPDKTGKPDSGSGNIGDSRS